MGTPKIFKIVFKNKAVQGTILADSKGQAEYYASKYFLEYKSIKEVEK